MPPLSPVATHLFEGPHTSFVAGPPRLDARPDPDLLLREFFVEQLRLTRLRFESLFAPCQERAVIAGPIEQPSPFDLDDPRRQTLQEHAIVRHEDQRDPFPQQKIFEPGDRTQVEMVGGLVQQQHRRPPHQRAGQQHPAFPPGRQGVEQGVGIQRHPRENLPHLVFQTPPFVCGQLGLQAFEFCPARSGRAPLTLMHLGQQCSRLSQPLGHLGKHAAPPPGRAKSPANNFSRVDLPAPFLPSSPIRSPRSIWKEIRSSRFSPPNVKHSSRTSINAIRFS